MKKPKHGCTLRFFALTAALAGIACSSDSIIDPSDRPQPPPADAFFADFSFFEESTPDPGGTTSSWAQALQTVALAQADMEVLEIPEALLRAANAAPGTREGSAWYWPFSTTVDGNSYDGEVRSTVVGNQYAWDLLVTSPDHAPQLNNYLWGTAITPPGFFEGQWWIADAEAGTDSLVARVSWITNPENGINFAFSDSDSAGWTYERSSAATVLTYSVYNQPHRRVTWFRETDRGSTWTAATSTACWDGALHDVAC